jgi:hypothetical protein
MLGHYFTNKSFPMMSSLRILFITIIALIGGICSVNAQSPSDTIKHEFGFGTNIIIRGIFNSSSAPFDLSYRKKVKKGYLRIGNTILLSSSKENYENSSSYTETQRAELNLGKEGRAFLAQRWLLNYGGELNLGFSNSKRVERGRWSSSVERISFSEVKEQGYTLGFRPFFGLIFKISERLILNTEASVRAGVQRAFYFEERFQFVNGVREETFSKGNGDIWKMYFHTQPASNIFVYYRF